MPSYENKRFVDLARGEWCELLFASEVRSRRVRWAVVLRWLRWEAWRLTRLPDDVVRASDRDYVYLVHGGRPGHLRGWAVPGAALMLHGLRDPDVEAMWWMIGHNPPETLLPHLTDVRF